MTTFFLDLWQDLRQKRLWPIAVALLAATVAVPVMLAKSPSSPPPATMAGTGSDSKLPTVTLDASSVSGSHLDVFDTKNPFSSGADPMASDTPGGPGAVPLGDSVAKAVDKASGSAPGASGGSGGGAPVPGGSPSGDLPKGPDGKPISPGVHYFTYTADVTFGLRSRAKPYKGLRELDVLPDSNSPVVAFMGVRAGKTAVFFISDPAFRAEGEGSCQPSPDNCMFLYLKKDAAHDEETLSAQNGQVEYTLKLTGLHVKYLSESDAVGDTSPSKGSPDSRAKRSNRTLLGLPAVRLARR